VVIRKITPGFTHEKAAYPEKMGKTARKETDRPTSVTGGFLKKIV